MGQQIVDWSILNDPRVVEQCEKQARSTATRYDGLIEYGDLLQEAYITVATHPGQFQSYLRDDEMGLFAHALRGDLAHVANRAARYRARTVSFDEMETDW